MSAFVGFILSGLLTLSLPLSTLHAATFPCAGGDVPCLVAALGKANALPGERHTVLLGVGTYTLTVADNGDLAEGQNGLPVLTGQVRLIGAGPSATVIAREPDAPFFRLLETTATSQVTLVGLTLQGGELDPQFFGRGGCLLNGGQLRLRQVVLTECTAFIGGGLFSRGPVDAVQTAITHCTADLVAGGLASLQPSTLRQVLIQDNLGDSEAGIGYDPGGPLTIVGSVISGNVTTLGNGGGLGGNGTLGIHSTVITDNSSRLRGGGLELDEGTVVLTETAILRNRAEIHGGGFFTRQGTIRARRVLVAGNGVDLGVGGGIANQQGVVDLEQSVVVGNQTGLSGQGPDCAGSVQVDGRTLIGNPQDCDIQR